MSPQKASRQENIESTEINITPAPSIKRTKGPKKIDKPGSSAQPSLSSPAPKKSNSPQAKAQNGHATPVRTAATPAQAYAGPTFHASPAPSALPIPRFFSRSGTPQDKGSLSESNGQTTSQVESSEEESTKSEDSPTLRKSLQVRNQLSQEVSPLDIFFQADRQEKARHQLSTSIPPKSDNDRSLSQPPETPKAVKSFGAPLSQTSSHVIGSSMSNISLSEMDASENVKKVGGKEVQHPGHPGTHRSNTSPSIMMSAEDCKAKSIALKKLLMLPSKPGMPHTLSSESNMVQPLPDLYSSPSPQSEGQVSKNASNEATPTRYNLRSRRTNGGSPNQPQSRANQAQQGSRPRPISSRLRREVMNGNPSDTVELPSTPTPTRFFNDRNPHNNYNVLPNINVPVPIVESESNSRTDLDQMKPSVDVRVMEDALRKILKLESPSSNTATGA